MKNLILILVLTGYQAIVSGMYINLNGRLYAVHPLHHLIDDIRGKFNPRLSDREFQKYFFHPSPPEETKFIDMWSAVPRKTVEEENAKYRAKYYTGKSNGMDTPFAAPRYQQEKTFPIPNHLLHVKKDKYADDAKNDDNGFYHVDKFDFDDDWIPIERPR